MAARERRDPIPAPDSANAAGPSRGLAAIWALLCGLPIVVALVIGFADPAHAIGPALVALLFAALAMVGWLMQRLRRLEAGRAAFAARIETLEDERFEIHGRSDGAALPSSMAAALPLATVSHEMRTPLHGMIGLADLLAETGLSAEQRTYVEALRGSAAALARLVDDLLDASRIAAGRFTLEATGTAIEPLVEQVAELLAPRAHTRGIGLAARVTPGLPPLRVDAGRLRQVLVNLVGNAIAMTEEGAVLIAVDTAARPDGQRLVRFAVSDSGPGVSEVDRERIFADFEQGAEHRGAAGLGLAISQRIVGLMGGRIDVAPRAGGGSVFGFSLLLEAAGPSVAPGTETMLAGLSFLLAAPPTLEAEALSLQLKEAGAMVRIATTLADATSLAGAAAAAGQPYVAAVFDASLVGDRRAALERLRESAGRRLPVAVLIEPGERAEVVGLRDTGFDAYLIRPVRRSSLLRVTAEMTHGTGPFLSDPVDRVETRPPERPRRSLRVLVVEDDPVHALLVRTVLERIGHEVAEATGLRAARQVLDRGPVDLALVDLHLDAEDGLELLRRLAEERGGAQDMAILAMSGDGGAELQAAALAAGADLFLEKPLSAERLRRAVEATLSRRSAQSRPRHQTV